MMELDTGAAVSLVFECTHRRLCPNKPLQDSSTHIFRGTVGDPRTTGGGGAVWGAESTFTTVCSTRKGIQFVGLRLAATPLS